MKKVSGTEKLKILRCDTYFKRLLRRVTAFTYLERGGILVGIMMSPEKNTGGGVEKPLETPKDLSAVIKEYDEQRSFVSRLLAEKTSLEEKLNPTNTDKTRLGILKEIVIPREEKKYEDLEAAKKTLEGDDLKVRRAYDAEVRPS